MQVAQRGTSNTGITSSGYYTADRWRIFIDSAGTWTMNVESSAPANTEFRKSANVICTTADSSLSAGDQHTFNHRFEAQNLQGIKKGTADAESLTLSFYVKSSNTGTYICELRDEDNTRQISKSYTINTANTWEKKTITVPPDTTGQFDNDNELGLTLFFWLAAGSNRSSGTLNSSAWASLTDANRAVGQLNLANAVGNYWAVTGIQLETGTVATPFEVRSIAQELALCQRYFVKYGGTGTHENVSPFSTLIAASSTTAYGNVTPPVQMRVVPSYSSNALRLTDNSNTYSVTSIASSGGTYGGLFGTEVGFNVASGLTQYRPYLVQTTSTSGYLFLSAEL
jgi:hypothetical protein